MSIISRRQRESLLNDVSRMINNNNHTAFANHAKIAETIGNGDMKIFVDSPKKEFVVKYVKKEIRINCSEQNIKDLVSLTFTDKSTIKGISDSSFIPSSSVAISTKWASNTESKLSDKAEKNHTHDEYADKDHTHNYSPAEHTHSEYSKNTHTHSEYSKTNHTHNEYSKTDHTHWNLPSKQEDFEEAIKDIVLGPTWLRVIKNVFSGIEVASDVVQYGYVAGIQTQVSSLHAAMAANGLIDAAQTTSTLGTALLGYSTKIKEVGEFVSKIGKSFDSVSSACKNILQPINQASEVVGKYARIVDNFSNCSTVDQMRSLASRWQNGADISRLPNVTNLLDMNLLP